MRWYKRYDRIIRRFTWLPITIEDETRWLEVVYLRQLYNEYELFSWRNREFVSKEEWLKYRKGEDS